MIAMSQASNRENSGAERREENPAWLALVRDQVASLRFGTVLITVHDARVVQVEKNEKVRLDQPTITSPKPG
jgi:hypothetical protein